MSSLLEKNQKPRIRKTIGDFVVYNIITQEQKDKLTKLLSEQGSIENNNGSDHIKANIDQNLTKELLREFTNIGDNVDAYSNEKLNELINNGNEDLKECVREVGKLISEFAKDYYYNIKMILEGSESNFEMVETLSKLNDFKQKMGLSDEQFNELIKNQAEINKLNKIPQDHKSPKKRGRKPKNKTGEING